MKFTKQAKIKARQAKYWMQVCHFAMWLFPDLFPTAAGMKPIDGYAADQIKMLLVELTKRRQDELDRPVNPNPCRLGKIE